MLEESIIDLTLAIFSVITTIIFGIMYRKGGFVLSWLFTSICFTIASTIYYFRFIDSMYRIMGNIFYFLAAIILSFSIFQEYNQIFLSKNRKLKDTTQISKNLGIFMFFSLFLINSIQIALIIYLILSGGMMLRILMKSKSVTHLFMLLAQVSAILTLFFSVLTNFSVQNFWEIAYVMKIILYTSLLVTGLAAPTENRLNSSEKKYRNSYNRAEFYKDIFAHDISNILQSVQTAMDLLTLYLKKPLELKELSNIINLVKNQVSRGAYLVSNIRKLSELEEIKLSLRPIGVKEYLNLAIDSLKKKYDEKEINTRIELSDPYYRVKANDLLLDIIENILTNAVKYNHNQKIEIFIKISANKINQREYIKFEFGDNGIGIPDNMKTKVFQRAFMKDKTISGMGLGLSLVKKIVEGYDGEIWIEDRIKGDYSKGSNFIVLIPAI